MTRNDYQPRTVPDKIGPVGAVSESSVRRHTRNHDPDDKPQPPVNYHLEFWVKEIKEHLVFNGKAICDPRTPDTCQADIEEYIFQIRPTNAAGVPTEATNDKRTKRITQHDVSDGNTDMPHVIFSHLERPKSLYWQLRVRVKDKHHRKSPWTAWTAPIKPADQSLPKPPTPTGLTLKFDRVERTKHAQYRAITKCNDIGTWAIPGDDDEDDVSRYAFQLQRTDAAGVPLNDPDGDPIVRTIIVEDKDQQAGNKPHAIFAHIGRWHYWRARVRSIDRYNRRGDFSAWTAPLRPADVSKPPNANSVSAVTSGRRVGIRWQPPTNPENVDMPDDEVSHYHVQRATDVNFANIVDNEKHVVDNQKRWVGSPNTNYWMRIRTMRDDGNAGDWQTIGPVQTDESGSGTPGPGSIFDPFQFGGGLRPVQVVSALPALPNAAYPAGSVVYLSSDAKLYRNILGGAWTSAVDGNDILANTITGNKIIAGTIQAVHIAASTITADKMAASFFYGGDFQIIGTGSFATGPPGTTRIVVRAPSSGEPDRIGFQHNSGRFAALIVSQNPATTGAGAIELGTSQELQFGTYPGGNGTAALMAGLGGIRLSNRTAGAGTPGAPAAGVIIYSDQNRLAWVGPNGNIHIVP